MKAPIAQAGGEAVSPTGCAFIFFWGLEIAKYVLKNRLGSDLAMLSWNILIFLPKFRLPGIGLSRDFKRVKVPGNPMKSQFCVGVFWGSNSCDHYLRA
jgi:hypothetical protein